MTVSIVSARWVNIGVTDGGLPEMIDDGAIAFEDGLVLSIGQKAEIIAAYPKASVTTHSNHMIIPGLVNSCAG